ncbi:isopentenyl phosphate kinase family protein [Candidatus Bathyarchaeota archaeon]|nr:isopentenyl phosphate kinase family protein [Candidatus Bathyarchaeota archaeon]MBS7628654.1 isopentenyl phosphate kinase family protein [Candidatus Bathyarchaeota archaeon]
MSLIIIKIGGSVITEKDKAPLFNRNLMEKIAEEISKVEDKLLLVHGAGSFGHPIAKKYSIHEGYRSEKQLMGVAELKQSMSSLTLMITETLIKHRIPVVPFLSSSCMVAEGSRLVHVNTEPFRLMINLGLVPICSGDVIADLKWGFSIISGDQIAVYLATSLNAKMVIFGCDVDGVFDSDPKKNPEAKLIKTITPSTLKYYENSLGGSAAVDVTKGMLGKMKESLSFVSHGGEVVIANLKRPENIMEILHGRDVPCTRFIPEIIPTPK